MATRKFEVIIIGGGPAGLSAALVLGRCRRKILVFDSGNYRNNRAKEIHGYLTRDGIPPHEFLEKAREELKKYNVRIIHDEIEEGHATTNGFALLDRHGHRYECKKLLLATGLRDNLPETEGVPECYGISVFHCPYCDGWENRDKKISIYGTSIGGFELAITLFTWSEDITLLTNGADYLLDKHLAALEKHKINVYHEPIKRLVHNNGLLESVELEGGAMVKSDAMFFSNGFDQRSKLGLMLGCNYTSKGVIINDKYQHTNINNLFVAGDASQDMQFVIVAAAEGAKAGVTINKELTRERMKKMFHENQPLDNS